VSLCEYSVYLCVKYTPSTQQKILNLLDDVFPWLQISSEMVYTYKGSNVISQVYDSIELYYPLE
jgi:hypothetical protein